ncbi:MULTISPECIES: transcription termination/antitermination protein NusG [Peptostreptococcus]|uniref:Transcription termination/antitermination protein NusG n=1 Tax=Peptostreptococcus porci TaxID=2652282 RepID=A0A6N7XEP0_9FIRM|nr:MULTISPECIES: transcription termination/antitermination protein NusG [Peptostreptococcus]MDD7183158.1 transcription termination/antitermination protein NusG [Peptostreptococcus porci]MDY2794315.1 transcription termination/antitermination protein NusG [Peptostreptococcus porci]MDY4127861.1 transcription termination/antitermination protein NusG [Peptostreptococcus porci]MDY4560271.1 transcription termination/antitermination protein NusG [Peptostreptococcus porci]MDY5435229.1 transcription ter
MSEYKTLDGSNEVELNDRKDRDLKWYVVHTYSGHENKVKTTIENTVKNRGMEDIIEQVIVPTEDVVTTTKTGKEKVSQRKIFPSYVIIKMEMTDESWYIVRNTKGVTGFVGPGSKPVALTVDEVKAMGIELPTSKIVSGEIDLNPGDTVKVISGAFVDNIGEVEDVNIEKKEVKVYVNAFGRKALVTLGLENIEKV